MLDTLLEPKIFALLAVYSLVWKAVVLWRAARRRQFVWFLVLLVTNTLGILDAVYFFFFGGGISWKDSDKV